MAVTVTEVSDGRNVKVATVTATADADTSAAYTYGTAFTPDSSDYEAIIVPGGATATEATAARLALWALASAPSATACTITKGTAVGSGTANAQARLIVKRRLSPQWT